MGAQLLFLLSVPRRFLCFGPCLYVCRLLQICRCVLSSIPKTPLCNFDPIKPHFYIVKLGFTGIYIICLFLLKNIDYGYSLEPPRRGGSNEYPQSMFWAEVWKISECFIWKFSFLVVKFSVHFNRQVFVIVWSSSLLLSLRRRKSIFF